MIGNKYSSLEIGKNRMKMNESEKWIVVENMHEAIISPEQYQAVQEALESRCKNKNKNTNFHLGLLHWPKLLQLLLKDLI